MSNIITSLNGYLTSGVGFSLNSISKAYFSTDYKKLNIPAQKSTFI